MDGNLVRLMRIDMQIIVPEKDTHRNTGLKDSAEILVTVIKNKAIFTQQGWSRDSGWIAIMNFTTPV